MLTETERQANEIQVNKETIKLFLRWFWDLSVAIIKQKIPSRGQRLPENVLRSMTREGKRVE